MRNMSSLRFAITIACLAFPINGVAQAPAVVDSLQPPAWVDRDAERIPLSPGMQLGPADRIRTGGLGKVIIRFEEGSDVKIGEQVELDIVRLAPQSGPDGQVFTGALDVLKGAFRFTTSLVGANRRRDFEIQIGSATVGIRGTDVWGKATPDRDFVVLLEGSIELSRQGEPAVKMDKALTIYDAPRGQPAKPVTAVDLVELRKWALETELDAGKGVITRDGPYRVYLASFRTERRARIMQKELRNRGYAVELFQAEIDSGSWIRLGIKGFKTYADANYFRKAAGDRLGIPDAWLKRH